MRFSYTEKKRIRRSFEKISRVMDLPNLLSTQLESYRKFLQKDSEKRKDQGLEKVMNSIFPIESHNGNARMEFKGYTLGNPEFNERECKLIVPRGLMIPLFKVMGPRTGYRGTIDMHARAHARA